MIDIVSPEKRSQMMAGIKGKDTKPEIMLRKRLYAEGYRYRKNVKSLPGKPDIVLKKYSTVIFINGCYWHGHSHCKLFKLPKSRTEFWNNKITENMERDQLNYNSLMEKNWCVFVVWECALRVRNSLDHIMPLLIGQIEKDEFFVEWRFDQKTNSIVMQKY